MNKNQKYNIWYVTEFFPKQRNEISMLEGNVNRICICDDLNEVERHRKIAIERINRIADMQKEKFDKALEVTDETRK